MCWKFVTELEVCGLVKDNTEEKKLLPQDRHHAKSLTIATEPLTARSFSVHEAFFYFGSETTAWCEAV